MLIPPESYLDAKRPPIEEAIALEGGRLEEAMDSLFKKGYFEPPPRPWELSTLNRGLGRKSFAITDHFGDVICEVENDATALLMLNAVNTYG